MINCFMDSLVITHALATDPVDTTAATSAYIDVNGYEGQVGVSIHNGIIGAGGSVTWTFLTAVDDEGTGEAGVVPVGGALTVANEANEPLAQMAVFDSTQLKGFLKVVGTVATDAGPLTYTIIGQKKYSV
jgi:hypothetical protein